MTDEKKTVAKQDVPAPEATNDTEAVKAKPVRKRPTRKKAAPKKKVAVKAEEKTDEPKKETAVVKKKAPAKKAAPKKKAPAKPKAAKKETAPTTDATPDQDETPATKPVKKPARKPAVRKKPAAKKPAAKKKPVVKAEEPAPEIPAEEKAPAVAPEVEPQKKTEKAAAPENTPEQESEPKAAAQPQAEQESPAAKPARQQQAKRRPAPKKKPVEEVTEEKPDPSINYKLLINADEPEECRIALLENGKVESFNVETVVRAQTKGNIYKGIITAVEPNLQAAFVDMGTGKNGFLPFSDIHPEYYCKDVGKRTHWKDLSIQSVIMKGQEVLVEVVKETTGNKGANLTTYLSMPGRYVVLMPGSDSHGISRKINNEERRSKLREIVKSANLPEEIGYIIRTASEDITKTAIMQDINYQLKLWEEIKANGQTMKAPALVYKETNVVSRFLRDHFTSEINEIMVDNQDVFNTVKEFIDLLPAKHRKTKVKLHRGSKPIFNQFQVEEQIEQMYQPQVPLPSGGSIVIDPTEALVAIDVNSGRTSKDKNFEKTIFLANMEAADELARQLRLRDLGGLIVVDFIDMRDNKNIREVEKKLRNSLKKDKAKIDTSRISKFGLMQISRQRLGPPIQKGNYITCEHCQGSGIIKSVETTSLALLRRIQTAAAKRHIVAIECELPVAIAQYLLNQKRADIVEMEKKYHVEIRVTANPTMTPAQEDIRFIKKEAV